MRITARPHAAGEAVLFDITGVEIFDVGKWNGVDYSDADLDEMVANFATLSAGGYDFPIKLGHGSQDLLEREDLPAAGYIKRLYRQGTKLAADLTRIPEKVKDCVELGAYRTVSAEIYGKVQLLGRTFKNVVSAIAFLGGAIPAVGTLDDIVSLYHRPDARPLNFSQLTGATRTLVTYAQKEEPVAKEKTVEDAQKLHDQLVELAEESVDTVKGKKGAPSYRAMLGEAIAKLRAMLKPKKSTNAVADSYEDRKAELQEAVAERFGGPDGYDAWIVATFDDHCVISFGGEYWQVPYADNEEAGVITLGDPVRVEQTWTPVSAPALNNVRNNTTPAKPGGEEEDMATSAAILKALGLPDGADEPTVLKAIADKDAEKAKFTANDTRLAELEAKDKKRDADAAVEGAISARKLLPAQREWAQSYAAKDPEGFKAYVEKSPELFKTGELGSITDAPEGKSPVSEFQAKVAEKIKANDGMTVGAAQKAVAAEEPELYAAIRALR